MRVKTNLYDCYYLMSKKNICKVKQKTHKYISGKLEERKPQVIIKEQAPRNVL